MSTDTITSNAPPLIPVTLIRRLGNGESPAAPSNSIQRGGAPGFTALAASSDRFNKNTAPEKSHRKSVEASLMLRRLHWFGHVPYGRKQPSEHTSLQRGHPSQAISLGQLRRYNDQLKAMKQTSIDPPTEKLYLKNEEDGGKSSSQELFYWKLP
ncbi:hypothetical protein O3P69_002017 [Scylla paramamosain]|uniref:Uncharacterized protein n=1 Tax=Scylla paramamosain TaxID=85552 RepID=A0AAW0V6Q6_SCYPA